MIDEKTVRAELQNIQKYFEAKMDMTIGDGKLKMACWARTCRDALELLKKQEPRVMTLEETGKADISWLEVKDMNRVMPCRIRYSDGWFIKLFEGSPERFAESEYGTELRCWTSRPTGEQRKAVAWDERFSAVCGRS